MIKIAIVPETLSDGSIVWNVCTPALELHAYDRDAARRVAEAILSSIADNTADDAKVVGDY